jgi:DNA gyrase subunit A
VIALIKAAKGPQEAKDGLITRFSFSEIQAQAILEMRLQRLTGLERDKILEEYKQVLALIEELKKILNSESLIYKVIKDELTEIKKLYGDARRTEIVHGMATGFEIEDLIADEETLVSITHAGYIKRTDPNQFKSQHRGGRGIRGVSTGDEDFVTSIFRSNTLSYLLCFTDKGRLYWLKVYKIPEASRNAKGKAIVNLIALSPSEKIKAILPVKEFKENEYILMVTRAGIVKKTALSEFKNVRASGLVAVSIDDGDELVGAKLTRGQNDIFLCTQQGMSIRFNEQDVRSMGRAARGVIGMNLDASEGAGDRIVAMEVLDTVAQIEGAAQENGTHPGFEILTVTENGFGKRTSVSEYRLQSRGGVGVINMKTSDRNGSIMGSRQVLPKDDVMLVSSKGQMIRIHVGEISEQGRNTSGVRLITLAANEKLVSFEYLAESAVDSAIEGTPESGTESFTKSGGGSSDGTPSETIQ